MFSRNFSGLLVTFGLTALIQCGYAQQINLGLTLAYNVFVVGEPVLAQMEAVNTSRDLLVVGSTEANSQVLIEVFREGSPLLLEPLNSAPLIKPFKLPPGQTMRHRLSLDKSFPLLGEGRYIVRAVFVHKSMRYESSRKSFNIVPGIPLLEGAQMFVDHPSLNRTFRLVYWHRNQSDRLFLRIEDGMRERVWDTIDLGNLMRNIPPKLDISPEGEVTVVHRATQDAFGRTVVWSLPDVVELVERHSMTDPEISASQRVKTLYGEVAEESAPQKSPWWKFW